MSAGPLADWAFEPVVLERELEALCARLLLRDGKPAKMRRACASVLALLEASAGATLQERWTALETEHWRGWEQGVARLEPQRQWTWGPAALVLARAVRPGWELLSRARLSQWISWLPDEDPLKIETRWLRERIAGVEWARAGVHHHGYLLGVRIMLRCGYGRVAQITDADLRAIPGRVSQGMDALDAVLCAEGILDRTPLRGAQRRLRGQRLTPAELVAGSQIPAQYRAAHQRYLEVYAQRVSDVYATTRHKHNALAHLWRWLDAEHPELRGPREVRRSHLQAFIPYAIAHARTLQRGTRSEPGEDRATAHS